MSKKILSVLLAIVVMASLCVVSASAVEAGYDDNKATASTGKLHVGDTVTFSVSLKYGDDVETVLQAIDAQITYDSSVLQIPTPAARNVKHPDFLGATTNAGLEGEILFNAANGSKGYQEKGIKDGIALVTVTFNVIKDADDATISFATKDCFDGKVDQNSLDLLTGDENKKDITSGFTAKADVTCPHKTTDSDKNTDTAKDTDTAKNTETEKADTETKADTEAKADDRTSPKTGDVATVAMMLVFAAAVVAVVVSKKRAA